MGGKIECYADLASLYSYLAFLELQRNRELLTSHNVEIDFHPVLLGAINVGSGNRPPWTLPAKAVYGQFDSRRSIARHPGLVIQPPPDLMEASKTVIALRALHVIKRTHPISHFLASLHHFFHLFWSPPNADLTTTEGVARAVASVPSLPGARDDKKKEFLFTTEEVQRIMSAAASEELKKAVKAATQEALDRGAFGAPWLWVTKGVSGEGGGEGEPFFGSDRFHFVYEFLGLPYQDVKLLPPGGEKAKL